MKMVTGFAIGMVVCLLMVLTIGYFTYEARAEENPTTLPDGTDLISLMPDVGKIYRQALGSPYRQVESEIKDPDIAKFYRKLMEQTGLDKIGVE